MDTITTTQEQRKKHLLVLTQEFHRSHYGDYDDNFDEFAATYLGTIDDEVDDETICDECGEEMRAKIHTDTELHPEDAADGLTLHEFRTVPTQPIPKYASCAEDETYGMISVFETLGEALSHQSGISSNGETLNVPAGVYDLDTGEKIETCNVTMTTEAYAVLCGVVHPTDAVNVQGIFSEAWEELRESFPLDYFKKVAKERGEDFYEENSGL